MSDFTLVSHLKNEIECRYLADVRYLKENRIPEIEDYSNVTTKPDLALVRSQDPVAMRNYQKKLADFQDSHKALLKTGRFMDVQGFDFEASHSLSMAKSFVSGRKTGVVVWNIWNSRFLSRPGSWFWLNRRKTPLCHPRLTGMFWHLKASPSLCLNSLILKII